MMMLSAISLTAPVMLTGLTLMALPVVAHLMHRRARRRVEFPSITMLRKASASQSSLFRLRRWWLLLLRCLAVAAVVAAFAQPLWLGPRAQATGGLDTAVVIVIDRSASAGQTYAGVSAATGLRAEAMRVLDGLTPGRDVANVVYASARPSLALPALTPNVDVLSAELNELEPGYGRADLSGALALAGRALAEHDGPRRLVILSDMQTSNWADVLDPGSPGAGLPAGTVVTVPALGHAPAGNIGLHGASATPSEPVPGQAVRLGVLVTNHGERAAAVSVGLMVRGREIDRRPIRVEPGATTEAVFTMESDGSALTGVEFTLPGDGLAADNRCYLTVGSAERSVVALITDDDTDRPGTAGYYLMRALAPFGDERDGIEVRRYRSTEVLWDGLERASAVVVGEVGALSPGGVDALRGYIEAGGGVVLVCGRGAVGENVSAIDPVVSGTDTWRPVAPVRGGEALRISDGRWRTPWLKVFEGPGRDALSQIAVRRAWVGDAAEQDSEIDVSATRLLWYADGTPALISRRVGAGRLVLANFGVRAEDSDLGRHGVFVALMQGLVDDLRGVETVGPSVVGATVYGMLSAAFDKRGPAPVTTGPSGAVVRDVGLSLDDASPMVVLDAPARPGFYTTIQAGERVALTAVNLDPRESDLRRVSADALHAHLGSGDATVAGTPGDAVKSELYGESLWGWLVLGALVCLGLEMGLLGAYRP